MSGAKIIEGLKDAISGNFGRVTIEGQVWERRGHEEWQPIETAPTGDNDFFLVCAIEDDRSPFVVRGSIFKSARTHPVTHHLSMAYLTHWMPLPPKPSY